MPKNRVPKISLWLTKEMDEMDQWASFMIHDSTKNVHINIQVWIAIFPCKPLMVAWHGYISRSSFISVNLACSLGFPFLRSAVCWCDWKVSRGCFYISLQCCLLLPLSRMCDDALCQLLLQSRNVETHHITMFCVLVPGSSSILADTWESNNRRRP